jgi:hypothetical protein
VLDNVVRIRTACAHNEPELLAALTSIARRDPPSVPGQPHQQQVQLLPSFQFRGETYPGEMRVRVLSTCLGVCVGVLSLFIQYCFVQTVGCGLGEHGQQHNVSTACAGGFVCLQMLSGGWTCAILLVRLMSLTQRTTLAIQCGSATPPAFARRMCLTSVWPRGARRLALRTRCVGRELGGSAPGNVVQGAGHWQRAAVHVGEVKQMASVLAATLTGPWNHLFTAYCFHIGVNLH